MHNNLKKIVLIVLGTITAILLAGFLAGTYLSTSGQSETITSSK